VQAVCGDDGLAGRGQHTFGDHRLGAARTLLARLEHEDDIAGQLVPYLGQQPGRADQDRDVQVVAAGVHGAGDLGRVLDLGELGDRQRVHVAAQEDG
jgi:hypothetical protein